MTKWCSTRMSRTQQGEDNLLSNVVGKTGYPHAEE